MKAPRSTAITPFPVFTPNEDAGSGIVTDPGQRQLAEMVGFLELGLPREALRIGRALLQPTSRPSKRLPLPPLRADTFREVVQIVVCAAAGDLWRWRKLIEKAYRQRLLHAAERRLARVAMLRLYHRLGDFTAAARCFPAGKRDGLPALSAPDLLAMMETCLELGRLRLATRVARECEARLEKDEAGTPTGDDIEASDLTQALAAHAARRGNWTYAEALWERAPGGGPLQQEALLGIVRLHAAYGLEFARRSIEALEACKRQPTGDVEIAAPGLERRVYEETQAELRRLARALERVLPPEGQREFGLLDPKETTRHRHDKAAFGAPPRRPQRGLDRSAD